MPEIVGERQAEIEAQDSGVRFVWSQTARDASRIEMQNLPGMYVSPLQLRLDDFSGEGERAPPV